MRFDAFASAQAVDIDAGRQGESLGSASVPVDGVIAGLTPALGQLDYSLAGEIVD